MIKTRIFSDFLQSMPAHVPGLVVSGRTPARLCKVACIIAEVEHLLGKAGVYATLEPARRGTVFTCAAWLGKSDACLDQ
jgi:hypothetical protein